VLGIDRVELVSLADGRLEPVVVDPGGEVDQRANRAGDGDALMLPHLLWCEDRSSVYDDSSRAARDVDRH
jgi:hypothetical protein